ncbi:MAG: aspartate kinase [Pseudomonadota bacterium]
MALIVQKYGGSSLASPKHIQIAADRIKSLRSSGAEVVVVVSAMGHTTDHLLKLAAKTVKVPPSRELDMLLTAGERVSMSLLAMSLQEREVPAISFTGSQSGILTTSDHSQAKILEIRPQRIQEELQKGKVVIIAGFQGVSREKEITTLGRGGSDTTAVALAAALKAERCEILTDVDGIFSADPRIVTQARLFNRLSYEECLELASLGAKMQPRSIELARRFRVKVWIGSSQNIQGKGTKVGFEDEENKMEKPLVKGIATKDGFHYFSTKLDLKTLAGFFQQSGATLRFFNIGDGCTTFLCDESQVDSLRELLKKSDSNFKEVKNVSTVSVVGEGVSNSKELLPKCLSILESLGQQSLIFASNTLSLTLAVSSNQKALLTQVLHQELIEKDL